MTLTGFPLIVRDVDDALSCKLMDDGSYEIGVHIADVRLEFGYYAICIRKSCKIERESTLELGSFC